MIIGISGKIHSGKDTVAKAIQYLTEYRNSGYTDFKNFLECYEENCINENSIWRIKKNAGKLKQIVSLMLGIDIEKLEKESIKNQLLTDRWQIYTIYNFDKITTTIFYTENEAIAFCNSSRSSQYSPTYKKSQRTVRWLMQYIGTELFRDNLHRDVHINMLFEDYTGCHQGCENSKYVDDPNGCEFLSDCKQLPNWLITDVRFRNETTPIFNKNGFIIRTNRRVYYWKDNDKKFVTTTAFVEEYEGLTTDLFSKNHRSETELDDFDQFKYSIDNNGSLEELFEQVEEICLKENLI